MLSASRRCRWVSRIIVASQKPIGSNAVPRRFVRSGDCEAANPRAHMPRGCGARAPEHKRRIAALGRKLKEFQIHKVTLDYTSLPQPKRELQSNRPYGAQLPPSRRSPRAGWLCSRSGLPAAADGNPRRVACAGCRDGRCVPLPTPRCSPTGGRRSRTRFSISSSSRRWRVTRRRSRRMRASSRPAPGAVSPPPISGRPWAPRPAATAPTPKRASAIRMSVSPAAPTRSTTPASTPAGSWTCSAANAAHSKQPMHSSARAKRTCATCS